MLALLAADLAAGAAFLRAHPSIDKDRVGFAGGSQAGWIVPVAATLVPEARFAVIISGPTISVKRQIYYFDLADGTTATQAELSAALAAYTGPDGFDPVPTLESVGLPILWLYGGQDRAVRIKLHRMVDARPGGAVSDGLPTWTFGGETLLKRHTLILRGGRIEQVLYPVFPPDADAGRVCAWLSRQSA